MDPKFFGLNETIGKLIKVPADQARIVATAVAMAITTTAALPSSTVEDIAGYYGEQVYPVMVDRLSEINESVVFGAKLAQDYAYMFWQMRYYAAFPLAFLDGSQYRYDNVLQGDLTRNLDINMLWCGGVAVISSEMAQFMNKYKVEIMTIAAYMTTMLAPKEAEAVDG